MSFYMTMKVLAWLIFLEHYIIRASHCQPNWSPTASCLGCNANAAGEGEQDWARTCPPFPGSQWKAGQAAMDAASLESVMFSHQGNEHRWCDKSPGDINHRGTRFMRLETKQHIILAGWQPGPLLRSPTTHTLSDGYSTPLYPVG